MTITRLGVICLFALVFECTAQTPTPKLVSAGGRHALLVDGSPYLVLGAQIAGCAAREHGRSARLLGAD